MPSNGGEFSCWLAGSCAEKLERMGVTDLVVEVDARLDERLTCSSSLFTSLSRVLLALGWSLFLGEAKRFPRLN